MKSAEFIKKITSSDLPPCILLLGEDLYFVDGALKKIKSVSGLVDETLDFSKYDEENIDGFLQSLDMFPFLSQKRVSVLSVEKIEQKKKTSDEKRLSEDDPEAFKNKQHEKMLKSLKKYAESPNLSTVAVVCIKGGITGIDGFETVDCGKESLQNIVKWIVLSLKKKGLTISDKLAETVATRCNLDMKSVKNCTDILAAYKGSGELTQENIDNLVADEAEAQVFDLVNAIVDKNTQKAFSLIEKIKAQKIAGTAFAAMLYNNYRRMFLSCVSTSSDDELAKELNVKPYAIKKARELGKKYSPRRLKDAMEYLAGVDAKIKNGKIADADTIENCVFHLANI